MGKRRQANQRERIRAVPGYIGAQEGVKGFTWVAHDDGATFGGLGQGSACQVCPPVLPVSAPGTRVVLNMRSH